MGVRRNIATNAAARDAYVEGVRRLKAELTGQTTTALGIPRRTGVAAQPLSTWDLFVLWHVRAMMLATPAGSDRNAAHRGPAFLPWHRWMLLLLEFQLQRVLGDLNFGLPYWDWATDGELSVPQQPLQPVWAANSMGGDGRPADSVVTTGPFGNTSTFRIRVETDAAGNLWATNRPLRRRFRSSVGLGLPRKQTVRAAVQQASYDQSNWDAASGGMRNLVEGWAPPVNNSSTHNRVHVWVSGDMGPASSPNDPVFYLNHCNVDRIWAAWQQRNPAAPYQPATGAPQALFRHRLGDPVYSPFTGTEPRISQLQNVSQLYTYDSLQVD